MYTNGYWLPTGLKKCVPDLDQWAMEEALCNVKEIEIILMQLEPFDQYERRVFCIHEFLQSKGFQC